MINTYFMSSSIYLLVWFWIQFWLVRSRKGQNWNASGWRKWFHCQYVPFSSRFSGPMPIRVFVTANHGHSSSIVHDFAFIWVEDVTTTHFKACLVQGGHRRHHYQNYLIIITIIILISKWILDISQVFVMLIFLTSFARTGWHMNIITRRHGEKNCQHKSCFLRMKYRPQKQTTHCARYSCQIKFFLLLFYKLNCFCLNFFNKEMRWL